jgi:hypothetical protein
MSYKPDQQELMAYLYNELEGEDKIRVEQYLAENPDARKEFQQLGSVSKMLGSIKDKEVIAPPIFIPESNKLRFWDAPYFRTVISIAASLILVLLVGKFSGARMSIQNNELRLSFGEQQVEPISQPEIPSTLSANEVQQMINQSLQVNNSLLTDNWEESRKKLEKSIQGNLVINSEKMNDLVKQASSATQDQVQQYVASIQSENMKMVKDYFMLTSTEQKQYIEGLLVDFAKYLQQQRRDDLQLVQLRINSLEQNTNVFQQETEQILTSIISSVGAPIETENKY